MMMVMWQSCAYFSFILDIITFIILPACNKINYIVSQCKLELQEVKICQISNNTFSSEFFLYSKPLVVTAFSFIIPLQKSSLIAMGYVSNFCDRHLRIMAPAFALLFMSNCSFYSSNNSEGMIFEQCRLEGHRQFLLMSMIVTSCYWKKGLML